MDRATIAPAERHAVDDVADLYSVLVAIEKLEKANTRDLIASEQYETALQKLRSKYHSIVEQLKQSAQARGEEVVSPTASTQYMTKSVAETVGSMFLTDGDGKGLDRFISEYSLPVPSARARLQGKGVSGASGNVEAVPGGDTGSSSRVDPKLVLEVGQHYITLMDCLKLQQTAVDQLHPVLSDLINGLRLATPDFDGIAKLDSWFERLNVMHPSDQLDDRDTREFAFDLDRSYQSFHRYLQGQPK